MEAETVAKGEFARMRNVSAARVSQWIREGKIGPDALAGEGRSARIIVPVATRQLKERLDTNQRFGLNGLGTRLDDEDGELLRRPARAAEPPRIDPVEARIKTEKLRQAQIQTERMEEERRASRGVYMGTDDARAEMSRLAGAMLRIFEGSLTEFATAIAAKFEVPQRDVIHLLKAEFRKVREKASAEATQSRDRQQAEREAEDQPQLEELPN